MKKRIDEPTKFAYPYRTAEWNDLPDWFVRVEGLWNQAVIHIESRDRHIHMILYIPVKKADAGPYVSHAMAPFEFKVVTKRHSGKFIGYEITISYK